MLIRTVVIVMALAAGVGGVGQALAQPSEDAPAPEREPDPRLLEWIERVRSCTRENAEALGERIMRECPKELLSARDKRGMTLAMHAARHAMHYEVLFWTIQTGDDPNARDDRGMTALMHTAYHPDDEIAIDLVIVLGSKRADATLVDDEGMDLLMRLCRGNHRFARVRQALVQEGVSLEARDHAGFSAVAYAAMHNTEFRIWDELIKHGADLSATYTDEKLTPLHLAARENMAEVAVAILRHGADVNARDIRGNTALFWALLQNKDPLMVRYLLGNGADATALNDMGASVIHAAAYGGQNAAVVRELIERGAPVENADRESAMPSPAQMHARFGQDPEVWALLAEHGADMNRGDAQGVPMIMQALTHKKGVAFVRAMLDAGCSVDDAYEPFNTTPLTLACREGSPEMVGLLLDRGADATVRTAEDKGVLDYAAMNPALADHPVLERLREAAGG